MFNRLKDVEKSEFDKFIWDNPYLKDNPIDEATTIVAMQWLDDKGTVRAQAIYSQPSGAGKVATTYQIEKPASMVESLQLEKS